MKSGPHMVACTAKPISIGLQPSEKSWRHQRLRSPVNRPRKRSDGHLYVLRLPERSRWPANAARHPEMLTASAAAIRALSGCQHLTDTGRNFADPLAPIKQVTISPD